ncbi:MAG: hypothetical protein IT537_08575 [Hyphomicrobiales bacterium]|nr:hypothetical protein [Hyphomicrobiales bacterium]
MLLVESDAKERMCPLRSSAAMGAAYCVGSQCMAWRWRDEKSRLDRRGYCGLAGALEQA